MLFYSTKLLFYSKKLSFLFKKIAFSFQRVCFLYNKMLFYSTKLLFWFVKKKFLFSTKLLTRGVARTENAWEKEAEAAAPQNIFRTVAFELEEQLDQGKRQE